MTAPGTSSTGMTVAELIEASLRGRTYARLAQDCGTDLAGVPLVTATNMREIAKPERDWKNFIDPPTMVGLARGLSVSFRVVLHAQARSIAQWYAANRPDVDVTPLELREEESLFFALLPTGTGTMGRDELDAVLPVVRLGIEAARLREQAAAAQEAAQDRADEAPPKRRARRTDK